MFGKLGCYPDKIRGSNDPSDQNHNNNNINNNIVNNQNHLSSSANSSLTHLNNNKNDHNFFENTNGGTKSQLKKPETVNNNSNNLINSSTKLDSNNNNNTKKNLNSTASSKMTSPTRTGMSSLSSKPPLPPVLIVTPNAKEDTATAGDAAVAGVTAATYDTTTNTTASTTSSIPTINNEYINTTDADELLKPSSSSTNTTTTTTSEQMRKKIILGKGYSLMDWIRYTKETPDLAGNKGILRKITKDELAKHNKANDCWLAIYDKVYNVTPYMKYHPGGVDELMKGAGLNATELFNKVHPWVNITSMLEKCLIGHLVVQSSPPSSPVKANTGAQLESVADKSSSINVDNQQSNKKYSIPIVEIPVLDSYQSNSNCIIVLYTNKLNRLVRKESLIIDKKSSNNNILLFLYTPDAVYKYELEIPAPTEDFYDSKHT